MLTPDLENHTGQRKEKKKAVECVRGKKKVFWDLDTLQWSNFTSNTNNNSFLLNTSVSGSPAVSRSFALAPAASRHPAVTPGVRKLAGKNHLFVPSKPLLLRARPRRGSRSKLIVSTLGTTRGSRLQVDRSGRTPPPPPPPHPHTPTEARTNLLSGLWQRTSTVTCVLLL